jgi:hypothetical protein
VGRKPIPNGAGLAFGLADADSVAAEVHWAADSPAAHVTTRNIRFAPSVAASESVVRLPDPEVTNK